MANTSAVYARIDSNLKENAENVLHKLGITPSSAIQMLYSQIVLTQSFPINLKLPYQAPTAIGGMNQTQLNAELEKGYSSAKNGKTFSADEVDKMLKEDFNI